ncbi:hypothetical protein [Streptomyces mobaraensis]|uniref:Uncharacterized protein n=1 Tax=Streptomyces mobaraensis TaxID=35621 RepID=A0A5N5WFC5_STRMB|nr:hypothetical protein [Streptomyces mobaraensis]KAB7852740.1 hypothetical protein FRZ00_00595 [Streptomyces mobaraensis]
MERMRKLALALTAVGVVGLPMTTAATAHADIPSVQVAISTYYSDWVRVCGWNQYDNKVCYNHLDTPGSGYTRLSGWWWQKDSTVTITGTNSNTGAVRNMSCYIPKNTGNPYYCDGRSRKEL